MECLAPHALAAPPYVILLAERGSTRVRI